MDMVQVFLKLFVYAFQTCSDILTLLDTNVFISVYQNTSLE